MPRWRSGVSWCLALGAIAWLVLETRRLAELAGRHEAAARAAGAAAAAPAAIPLPAPGEAPPPAVDALDHARLQLELHRCEEQLRAVTALLQQREQADRERAAAAAALAERAARPLAPGVRACLEALQGCLRAEGFSAQRFLTAGSLVDRTLTDVELLDVDPDGFGATLVQAGRMTARLDRAASRFELRFHDGRRSQGAWSEPLPPDGWVLTFRDVDGRAFEAKLPFLVQAEGAYPTAADDQRPATDVDPITRRQWLERLERLLAEAGTEPSWRVSRFRGMQDGWFLGAELVGTDVRHHVVAGAHCDRIAVEVDATTGTVSLLLRDGVLRRGGAASTIAGEGYRMLLPKLTPKLATDAMYGMVVSR